ncbi:MAG: hypothetical protein NTV22_10320 [bacterium]|nr:hypothetical protein [bacterium]
MTHDEKSHMKSLGKSDAKIFASWLVCAALAGVFLFAAPEKFRFILLWPLDRALERFSPDHAHFGTSPTLWPELCWPVWVYFTALVGVVLLPVFYMSSMPHRIAKCSWYTLMMTLLAMFLCLILLLFILAIFCPMGMM